MEIFEKKFWKLLTLFWFRYYLMNFETELKNGKPRKKRQQYQGKKVGWLHFVFAWTKTERVAHIFFPSKLSCFVFFFFCFFHIWFLDDVKTKTTKKKLLKCCENSFTMSFVKKTFFFYFIRLFYVAHFRCTWIQSSGNFVAKNACEFYTSFAISFVLNFLCEPLEFVVTEIVLCVLLKYVFQFQCIAEKWGKKWTRTTKKNDKHLVCGEKVDIILLISGGLTQNTNFIRMLFVWVYKSHVFR